MEFTPKCEPNCKACKALGLIKEEVINKENRDMLRYKLMLTAPIRWLKHELYRLTIKG